jgi:hypothetical protein
MSCFHFSFRRSHRTISGGRNVGVVWYCETCPKTVPEGESEFCADLATNIVFRSIGVERDFGPIEHHQPHRRSRGVIVPEGASRNRSFRTGPTLASSCSPQFAREQQWKIVAPSVTIFGPWLKRRAQLSPWGGSTQERAPSQASKSCAPLSLAHRTPQHRQTGTQQ